jgi:hypothetical protein
MENDTVRPFWRNPETHFPTYANQDAIMTKIAPAVSQAKTYAKPDELVESAIKDNVHQSTKDYWQTARSFAMPCNRASLKSKRDTCSILARWSG